MLSDRDIEEAMRDGEIEISPFERANLHANSYDVRLANDFILLLAVEGEPQYFGPLHVETGRKVLIPYGGTLLGHTVERVATQHNVVALMKSRSTTRRTGVSVCMDAGLGDVGYPGRWTCELSAHVLFPALISKHNSSVAGLYKIVGERFAQMEFYRTETPPEQPYDGQYRDDDFPLCMVPEKYRNQVLPWSALKEYSDILAKMPWVK